MVFCIRLSIGTIGEQADKSGSRISRLSWALQTTARAACPLWASAAVTAVTDYSSNNPLFFGRPICATGVRELVMLSALAALGCGLAAAQGDLPDQPPGRSCAIGRFLLVSLRTNARVIPRARLDIRDRDCARPPWHARRFVW